MTTIFNKNQVDTTKQPMLFGEELNVQRYDKYKYPIFEKLTKQQMSFFWIPEEVSVQKDRNDFQKLSEVEKFIFTSNLKYQTLLDSVQGRSPAQAFLPFTSIPELESCMIAWQMFEMIHSRSYTYVIKNLYSDPSEVFDHIIDDEMIIERAESVTKYYDVFIEHGEAYRAIRSGNAIGEANILNLHELKKKLYLALMSVNILEGIRFYVSFACTFAFGENKLLEGSAKIISLIARDENVHLAITQNIINSMRKGEEGDEWQKITEECKDEVIAMFRDASSEEKRWAKYLFKDGSMIGLNDRLLCNYVEHITNKRMKTIGLPILYGNTPNPLTWMDHWLTSKNLQIAPMETEIESYSIGAVRQDITDDTFGDTEL